MDDGNADLRADRSDTSWKGNFAFGNLAFSKLELRNLRNDVMRLFTLAQPTFFIVSRTFLDVGHTISHTKGVKVPSLFTF